METFAVVCSVVCAAMWVFNGILAHLRDDLDWRMSYILSCVFLAGLFAAQAVYFALH